MTSKKTPTIKDLVDELGQLESEGVSAKYARMGALRKTIALAEAAKPEDGFKIEGHVYVALVSARGNQTGIKDLGQVFKLVLKKRFLAACSMTLVKFRELIPDPLEQERLLVTEQTGPRTVKTFMLAEAAKAA